VSTDRQSGEPGYAIDRIGQVAPIGRPATKSRTLRWGMTKRCPRCGNGHLFRGWFTIVERCPRCGLRFEREEGYWVGAMAINLGVTLAVFVVVFAIGIALTAPDIPVIPLLAILVPLMIIVPIAGYPFSKTLWMAIDRGVLQRLDRNERLDEQH
jgi:uncharacterized protein (DUF983 family)